MFFYRNDNDRTDIGYDANTGKVNVDGQKFSDYLIKELDPLIEKKYISSGNYNRIYLGWSYLANYSEFFMTNFPSFFDGYLLFAPEFSPLISTSKVENKRVSLIVGENDEEHRIENLNEFEKNLASKNIVNKIVLKDADHMNIIFKSLHSTLDSFYKDYLTFLRFNIPEQKENSTQSFINTIESINKKNYKTGLRSNSNNFMEMTNDFKGNEDELVKLSKPFLESDDFNAPILEILGIYFLQANDKELALKYLLKAKENYELSGKRYMMYNTVRNLVSLNQDDPNKAKEIIKQTIDQEKSSLFIREYTFMLIEINIRNGEDLDEGIAFLKSYLNDLEVIQPSFKTNYLIGLAYYSKNEIEKALPYLNTSIKSNKNFSEANELLLKLKKN